MPLVLILSKTYRWTTGQNDVLFSETTHRTDLWNPVIWQPSNFWNFFTIKSQTLGPGQFRALGGEHVFVFQYKCPVDSRPSNPNLRLINH